METRITSKTVTFVQPFVLPGFERVEPAGSYIVETEEERIENVSVAVWRRTATVFHLTNAGTTEYLRIDPADLKEALTRDGTIVETARRQRCG